MHQPTAAPRAYYPALDILRGLAIIIVVLYHNFDNVPFFRFGWLGVDLFFALSGFLITDLLLKSRDSQYYFRNFYIRRFLRIFPLYYLVLALFFTLSPILFSEKGPETTFTYYDENKVWFWSHFQNWLLVHKGPAPVPFLSHFWSLAIEEQFYLFWPLLLFFIKKLNVLRNVIIGLIATAIIIRITTWMASPHEVEAFYCSTFTRMDSLLMGCLLAVHMKQGFEVPKWLIKTITAGFICLIAASLLLFGNLRQDNLLFPTIGYSLTAAFFTCMLYVLLKKEESLVNILSKMKPLSFIGRISYGMYVYHIPIYLVLGALLSEPLKLQIGSNALTALIISALSVILTIAASAASFYIVERPILNLKKHFP